MRPRELRIGHQDEKMQISIETIFKKTGKLSITDNGLHWDYSIQWCLMENVLFSLTIVLIDTCIFSPDILSSVRTNADMSCSNFIHFTYR